LGPLPFSDLIANEAEVAVPARLAGINASFDYLSISFNEHAMD